MRERTDHVKRHRKNRGNRWWIVLLLTILVLGVGGTLGYRWIKVQRANKFAAAADALRAAGKLKDAAVQYRIALQLDPLNYPALSGAARLATKADRPEAVEIWQKVLTLRQCTNRDREDYAEFLINSDRLVLAEKVLGPLLEANPDTKTLLLAARYSRKRGDNVKAIEYARIASKRAPDNETAPFQLAELLAQSADPADQAEAHSVLWEIAKKPSYRKPAIEALATAPQLTPDERSRLLQDLNTLMPRTIKDDLLAADMRIQLHLDEAAHIYQEQIERWRNGTSQEVLDLARWLNSWQQPELVLSTFPIERALQNNGLLLARLDALASLQRWNDIDDALNRTDVTLDPSVIETFHARTAQERGASLDAEVHWNHAISLASADPDKLRFVANFAEQSRATAVALKAYEQLARFPEHADFAYHGIERVSQQSGDTAMQRTAMSRIAARAPEDPNAADEVVYLNLLLGEDIDNNLEIAKKLAEQHPNRLSFRVTAALGYLRQHDAASALAEFKGPAPIDWKRTLPAWRAVYAAALLGTERNEEARSIITTIPRDQLNPQERELIGQPDTK
jgi:hypothetical protein